MYTHPAEFPHFSSNVRKKTHIRGEQYWENREAGSILKKKEKEMSADADMGEEKKERRSVRKKQWHQGNKIEKATKERN